MIDNIIIKNRNMNTICEINLIEDFSLGSVHNDYRNLTKRLIETNRTVTTMESCTSGFIASLITDTEGSSAVLKGAFVTYSNFAKIKIGVPEEIINNYGVYSFETAISMAEVCRKEYDSDYGIGITGSLGNTDPMNNDSVPGEVFFAISSGKGTQGYFIQLSGTATRFEWKIAVAKAVYWVLKDII